MYTKSKCIATALFAAALVGVLAGCSGQQAASSAAASASGASSEAAASAASAEASATSAEAAASSEAAAVEGSIAPDQAYDEIANLMADSINYKTVTITQTNTIIPPDTATAGASSESAAPDASAEAADSAASASAEAAVASDAAAAEPAEIKSVYKFDIGGDSIKSTQSTTLGDSKIVYYVDGDKVVADCDGVVYGGTTSEFSVENMAAPSKVIETAVGELADLGECITNAMTGEVNGETMYTITVDPAKLAEVDTTFAELNKAVNISEIGVTYLFGADKMLKSITYADESDLGTTVRKLEFTGYDATTLEPAPEATKTYADFESDIRTAVEESMKDDSGAAADTAK